MLVFIQFLKNSINVKKGQKFRIDVTIESDTPVLVPCEVYSNKTYCAAQANIGESGYLSGGNLVDITDSRKNCSFCINVYTAYKGVFLSKMDELYASYYNGFIELNAKLYDLNNNVVKNFEFISCEEISGHINEYQFVKTNDNGEVTLKFNKDIKI